MARGMKDGLAVWPPMATEAELTTAGLTPDGKHIQGWVMAPAAKEWAPHDGSDVLWLPPSATKSTDLDRAGWIVDMTPDPGEMKAWVTAQINKHDRYLEMIRDRVRAGTVRLTAFLAKMLGLPFEDGVELRPFQGNAAKLAVDGPAGAYKAMSDLEAAIVRTSASDPFADPELKAIAQKAVVTYLISTGGDREAGREAAVQEVLAALRARSGQPS